MQIRDATIADLAADVVAGPDAEYASQMTTALDAADAAHGVVLVVDIAGHIVARAAMGFDTDAAYVFGVIVDPDHRRRGLASALMENLEQRAVASGRHRVRLEVGKANSAAVALYERRGYEVVGSNRTCGLNSGGRVIHVPEPVWIMERRIEADPQSALGDESIQP